MQASVEVLSAGVVEPQPVAPVARRIAEVSGLWAVWVGVGTLLRLGGEAYLLLGVPLTVGFQLFVRRRPLADLWVRGERFRLGWRELLVALPLAFVPVFSMRRDLHAHAWSRAGWDACALVGAFAAGFAFMRLRRFGWKQLALCAAIGGSVGSFFMLAGAGARFVMLHQAPHLDLRTGATSFVSYVAVCFALEEVSFRGAIDAHLNPAGRWRPELAVLSSALWGLWHLPLVLAAPLPTPMPMPMRIVATSMSLVIVHVLLGVPLSYFYGRTGNLAVSSTTHALADAVRNALGMMPSV